MPCRNATRVLPAGGRGAHRARCAACTASSSSQDEVSHTLLDADNTFVCVSLPLVNGAQVATHMPIAGPRGADFILEHIGAYLDTLS